MNPALLCLTAELGVLLPLTFSSAMLSFSVRSEKQAALFHEAVPEPITCGVDLTTLAPPSEQISSSPRWTGDCSLPPGSMMCKAFPFCSSAIGANWFAFPVKGEGSGLRLGEESESILGAGLAAVVKMESARSTLTGLGRVRSLMYSFSRGF